ncbi:MAG: glycosyltransferase [Oscillospiraceae bacterium]
MRVLVLSVTAGYGHISTAKAIADEFTARGIDVHVEDLYQQISRITYDIIDNGYLFTVKHFQNGFKHAYQQMENSEAMRKLSSFFTSNTFIAHKLARHLHDYMPDVIISTHPFAGQVLNRLKEQHILMIPCIGIITDYCIHPGWEDCGALEYIVTASELLNYIAQRKNIAPGQIAPLGIPVRPIFRNKHNKVDARRALGLDEDKETILIMGGSMGYGNMLTNVSAIDRLNSGLQIVCICGNNEKLRKHLTYLKTNSSIVVKGFVDNVDIYMDAADCIVTKPGGLTVTEALCKKLPMILVNPIPGHEEHNIDFLMNNGAAIRVTSTFSISEAVYYLFENPGRLALMSRSIELVAKPDAAERICDLAQSLCRT